MKVASYVTSIDVYESTLFAMVWPNVKMVAMSFKSNVLLFRVRPTNSSANIRNNVSQRVFCVTEMLIVCASQFIHLFQISTYDSFKIEKTFVTNLSQAMIKVMKWKIVPNVRNFDAKMVYAFYTKKCAMV